MNKIYYISIDFDYYDSGRYLSTNSSIEGFWMHKPSDKEVEKFLLKKHPNWSKEIEHGKHNKNETSVVWDVLGMDLIK